MKPIITITKKQLIAWKWYTRSGSIRDKSTGKRIYTDHIMTFIQAAHNTSKIVKNSRIMQILAQNRDDNFVYFSIGEKNYKVLIR